MPFVRLPEGSDFYFFFGLSHFFEPTSVILSWGGLSCGGRNTCPEQASCIFPGSLKPECLGAEDAIQDELRVSVFFLAAELKKFRGGSSTESLVRKRLDPWSGWLSLHLGR